jgi:hypothetical protein
MPVEKSLRQLLAKIARPICTIRGPSPDTPRQRHFIPDDGAQRKATVRWGVIENDGSELVENSSRRDLRLNPLSSTLPTSNSASSSGARFGSRATGQVLRLMLCGGTASLRQFRHGAKRERTRRSRRVRVGPLARGDVQIPFIANSATEGRVERSSSAGSRIFDGEIDQFDLLAHPRAVCPLEPGDEPRAARRLYQCDGSLGGGRINLPQKSFCPRRRVAAMAIPALR